MRPKAQVRRFAPIPTSVHAARAFVRGSLQSRVSDDTLEEIELVVAELVTNAIIHTAQPVELTVEANGSIRVAAVDGSGQLPVKRTPRPNDIGGRGLHIVDQLCDRWGVDRISNGKCVWCEIDLDPSP